MSHFKTTVLPFLFLFLSLQGSAQETSFPEHVGEIAFDSLQDDPHFTICNEKQVFQYYNTNSYYKDHKNEIVKYLLGHYTPEDSFGDQNGYLTVKFIINCKGETGRFRLFEIDNNYQPASFMKALSRQLLSLVKELRGWQPAVYKGQIYDSYQHITFHIWKGKIISITP
jgi:hypothetical protein